MRVVLAYHQNPNAPRRHPPTQLPKASSTSHPFTPPFNAPHSLFRHLRPTQKNSCMKDIAALVPLLPLHHCALKWNSKSGDGQPPLLFRPRPGPPCNSSSSFPGVLPNPHLPHSNQPPRTHPFLPIKQFASENNCNVQFTNPTLALFLTALSPFHPIASFPPFIP